ncbi:MAG: DDE-type integrase/transposase/recombinase [Chloroflexi bacterium]|nr:DDE-type integrase/transposase/recombinase [Chloroflexota bacterium]
MTEFSKTEDQRTELALFRYSLILPLLRQEHQPGGKTDLRRQIAAAWHDIPGSKRRRVGVSTLRRWEQQYRQHGFDGLKPRPRSDRGQSRTISPETLERAEALKRAQPHRSARSIITMLELDQTQPLPEEQLAERTLRRQLAQRGATAAQLLTEQRAKPYRRFERQHFGDLWQSDAMDGPWLPDPARPDRQRQVFLFAFLDDFTRLVPHARFYWNEQLPRVEDCFHRALKRYGRPLAIYVDQGAVYRSKQLNTACATMGVKRILARPYAPEGKGKIERFFSFVQSDFQPELNQSHVTTLALLNESFMAWLEVVYHRKLHAETGQSPLERFRQDSASTIRPVNPAELRQAFLHRAIRTVTKTATISFQGNRYRVPAFLRRQKIEIRFDPFDLSHLEIWHNQTYLQDAELEQLTRTTQAGVDPDPTPQSPPADPALDYLALLRAERDRLLDQQFPPLQFSQLSEHDQDDLDDPEVTCVTA